MQNNHGDDTRADTSSAEGVQRGAAPPPAGRRGRRWGGGREAGQGGGSPRVESALGGSLGGHWET